MDYAFVAYFIGSVKVLNEFIQLDVANYLQTLMRPFGGSIKFINVPQQ
jgi:hypothetical protein